MSQPQSSRKRAIMAGALGSLLVLSLGVPGIATADDGAPSAVSLKSERISGATLSPNLAGASGEVPVYVVLKDRVAAYFATQSQAVLDGKAAPENKAAEAQAVQSQIEAQGRAIADVFATRDSKGEPKVIYTTTNAVAGVAFYVDASRLNELAARSDVASITKITPQERTNKGGDQDVRALNSWVDTGQTGEGVTIAVIDTGVDYTHSNFGGPGTRDAFAEATDQMELPAADSGLYDPAKFVGGYDLAGDDYDADPSSSTYNPTPSPDGNPIDCSAAGHGSHVAGTAGGYGVNEDGSTFNGDYSSLSADQLMDMKIGPGTAPKANIAAFRVFGCVGSTNLTGDALDKVLDPTVYTDPSKMAKVVNLSLGSSFGVDTSAEAPIVAALQEAGILMVISAGNSGDVYNVSGSPGAYKSALTVANTNGTYGTQTYNIANVTAPEDVAGPANGQISANFDYSQASESQLTANEVVMAPTDNQFGCNAFPDGSLDGKWVWLQWSEGGEFPCGSAVRYNNAEAAGALGVLMDSEVDVFDAGIAGNATIPGFQFTKTDSDRLRPAAEAGDLQLTIDLEGSGSTVFETGLKDVIADSSSRGGHGYGGTIKPDIAAPGSNIGSTAVGTGNGLASMSGTSMAAPNVSGLAALVYGADGAGAQPEVVKSKLMNTSSNTVKNVDGTTPAGPSRAGTGRADVLSALQTPVYAAATDDPIGTSVVFGVVEAGVDAINSTKSITLTNTSNAPVTYSAALDEASAVPGATFSLSASSVTVPAGGTATVDVTLDIPDTTALAKSITPGTEREQQGIGRQYVAELQSRVTFAAAGQPTLNVVVQAAPKPTSDLSVDGDVVLPNGEDSANVVLTGRGINQGEGNENYTSLYAPFELGYQAESAPGDDVSDIVKAATLQAVGVNSTFANLKAAGQDPIADGMLNFGFATYANWPVLDNVYFTIQIDTNGDEKPEYLVTPGRLNGIDLNVSVLRDGNGEPIEGGLEPINGQLGDVDTNVFDSNVVTLPVSLALMDLDPKNPQFSYQVIAESQYATSDDDNEEPLPVTQTPWISYNPASPTLNFEGDSPDGYLFVGDTESALKVTRSADAGQSGAADAQAEAQTTAQALFLYLHNASGSREQVVNVVDEPTVTPSPTETPTGTPTPTGEPTETPTPTGEPTSTGTPSPSDSPTATPSPTGEPTATGGPSDTATPSPTSTDGLPDTGATGTGLWIGALALVLAGLVLIGVRYVIRNGKHSGA
ncbi:S8 family peptidase [Haematomicrobium sanguinis]|uniref:S8 family peptidase n=1 Tax=Haematomicrobium sanguinis TaxID=479106 RepID=UPI00146FB084|nr:S8 family serine peptidase [Haematomicrobium sanguinis]